MDVAGLVFMGFFGCDFVLEQFMWKRLAEYLKNHDDAPDGEVYPRPLGIYTTLLSAMVTFVCGIICILEKSPAWIIFCGTAAIWGGIALYAKRTKVTYDDQSISVSKPGFRHTFPLDAITKVEIVNGRPKGAWELILHFGGGAKLHFEQINFYGLNALYLELKKRQEEKKLLSEEE